MRQPLYAANWKMFKTQAETARYLDEFLPAVREIRDREIMIAPPFGSLMIAAQKAEGSSLIIAAQNMHFESSGAFTGEMSAAMIQELGCSAVILGHSERRHIFGEDDELINRKILAALDAGLMPVFCIGEKIEQREASQTSEVLRRQIEAGLKDITVERADDLVIAYEPVWAIGTGKTATPEIAQEAHFFIRGLIVDIFNAQIAQNMRILYGGSVKPANISELMSQPDLDGVLVGGASLDPQSFAAIVNHS